MKDLTQRGLERLKIGNGKRRELFDPAKGMPVTNRTPGSLTSSHIDHKSHQRRVEELRSSLMQQHGFAEPLKAEE